MASSVYESWKDLDITRDELSKLGEALKKEEFRKLLIEYCEEINDPANKKQFQEDVKQLELERGNEVTFINPVPGYVIKTSEGGTRKAFINVCANDNIEKPISNPDVQDGSRGLRWSLPYSLAQPREDYDKKTKRCIVYDVVFHPNTLHLASKNKAFCDMVNQTACDAVENNFEVKLDRKNLKFPKLQYKGTAVPAIIRKKVSEPKEMTAEEEEFFQKICPKKADRKRKTNREKKSAAGKNADDPKTPYTTPTFLIKHRNGIDMQEFTENRDARMHAAIPKELVVEIQLPLLKSADDMVLDVTEKHINLLSERPAKYKLDLTLPYAVFQDSGNAKFDKDAKRLTVVLPVRRSSAGRLLLSELSHDSGVESDHGTSPSDSASEFSHPLVQEIVHPEKTHEKIGDDTALRTNKCAESFLNPDIHYILPEHNCHVFENTLAFTLNVKNVDSDSVKTKFGDASVHVKFSSVSSGFFPINYAFYVEFHSLSVDPGNVLAETWDNNVVVQINVDSSDSDITSYLFGVSENAISEREIDEPSAISSKFEDDRVADVASDEDAEDEEKPYVEVKVQESEISISIQPQEETAGSQGDEESDRKRQETTCSESSGDELSLSCSQSPGKGRGILKRFSVSRSISESSIDDFAWTSSYENCAASTDSVIPEEGGDETSTSLKKTVRFSNVVSRQIFR